MNRAILAALVVLLCAPSAALAAYGKYDVTASHVHTVRVYRNAGPVTFETYDLAGIGADTVMHLLNSSNQEVKMNDDCSVRHRESCIAHTVPAAGWYLVVIRSYSTDTRGYCSLKVNGIPLEEGFPFGGAHVDANTVSGDIVQTALLNQGTTDTVLYGLDAAGHIVGIDDDAGVGLASRLPGAFAKVVVGTYGWTPDPTRVYINDAGNGHDHDGDGLGEQLESALCTCDILTPTPPSGAGCPSLPCQPPYTRHPEDSDGDGIRDDYEAFGVDGTDAYDYSQHLLKWGANPAHKDIFVEMEYDTSHNVDRMPPAQALAAAQAYIRAGTASHLKNRDNVDGVALHVDIGQTDPSCGTTCGDWGGVGQVDPNYPNPDYPHFAKVRRGVFHYGKGAAYPGVSGFGWAFAASPAGPLVAHELGHNLDLGHGGAKSSIDTNGKPNYQSLMSYLVGGLQFSLGEKPVLNPTSLCEANGLMISDPAKMFYLSAWGYTWSTTTLPTGYYGVDWNRDGVIDSSCASLKRADPKSALGTAQPERGRYYWHFAMNNYAGGGSPSIVKIWGRTYLAARPTGLLWTTSDFRTGCDFYDNQPGADRPSTCVIIMS